MGYSEDARKYLRDKYSEFVDNIEETVNLNIWAHRYSVDSAELYETTRIKRKAGILQEEAEKSSFWNKILGFGKFIGGIGVSIAGIVLMGPSGGAAAPLVGTGIGLAGSGIADMLGTSSSKEEEQIKHYYKEKLRNLQISYQIARSKADESQWTMHIMGHQFNTAVKNAGFALINEMVKLEREKEHVDLLRKEILRDRDILESQMEIRREQYEHEGQIFKTAESRYDLAGDLLDFQRAQLQRHRDEHRNNVFKANNAIAQGEDSKVYFRDQKGVLSGYREAALDKLYASRFFAGIQLGGVLQDVTSRELTAYEEPSISDARRLNEASINLAKINITQDRVFQQNFMAENLAYNELLKLRSRDLALNKSIRDEDFTIAKLRSNLIWFNDVLNFREKEFMYREEEYTHAGAIFEEAKSKYALAGETLEEQEKIHLKELDKIKRRRDYYYEVGNMIQDARDDAYDRHEVSIESLRNNFFNQINVLGEQHNQYVKGIAIGATPYFDPWGSFRQSVNSGINILSQGVGDVASRYVSNQFRSSQGPPTPNIEPRV